MLLGAHVSTAGGVQNAPANATGIGCETFQIFSKNQRQWNARPYAAETVASYRDQMASSGCDKVIVHDSYLINLGAPDAQVWARSRAAFVDEMERCRLLGIPYLNFHPGAHVGSGEEACLHRIAETVRGVLDERPDDPTCLLIENTAGQGTNVGHRFEHLATLLDGIDAPARMGVCLDTQHSFAAGYDLSSEEGYEATFGAFDDLVGLKMLKAFHLNDSKTELGGRVDRHENIGAGLIGTDLFERLVNDRRFTGVPGVLETPGGPDMWAKELRLLKGLRRPGAPDA